MDLLPRLTAWSTWTHRTRSTAPLAWCRCLLGLRAEDGSPCSSKDVSWRSLRTGHVASSAGGTAAQSAEDVAQGILDLIRTGREAADLVPAPLG